MKVFVVKNHRLRDPCPKLLYRTDSVCANESYCIAFGERVDINHFPINFFLPHFVQTLHDISMVVNCVMAGGKCGEVFAHFYSIQACRSLWVDSAGPDSFVKSWCVGALCEFVNCKRA